MVSDDPFFQSDWVGACWDGWAGDRTAAGLICRLWIVGPKIGPRLGWSAGSGCDTPLQKQAAGASPVAVPMPKSVPR